MPIVQVGMDVEACIPGMNAWHPAVILRCNQDEYDIEFTEYPYAKEVKTGIKRREIRTLVCTPPYL